MKQQFSGRGSFCKRLPVFAPNFFGTTFIQNLNTKFSLKTTEKVFFKMLIKVHRLWVILSLKMLNSKIWHLKLNLVWIRHIIHKSVCAVLLLSVVSNFVTVAEDCTLLILHSLKMENAMIIQNKIYDLSLCMKTIFCFSCQNLWFEINATLKFETSK